jgi:PAS domain S-box-containing protein
MGLHTATPLNRLVKSAGERTVYAGRFNIGPRLILGFVFILASMLAADAVVLWQFHVVRTQAERMNGIDRKLVAVLRVHTSLLAFHDRLEDLADSQDVDRLVTAGGPLRTAVLEDTQRAIGALSLPPFEPRRDPTILPTLHVLQSALPSQLDAITTLARSGDWRAVHLRLANEVTQLESMTSAIVENVDHEVGEEQAQTVRNIKRVQRLVFVMVPLTALVTLLIAATLGVAITRSITRPLARLVEGSQALARGEFQHQVAVTGNDELAHVGRVFNDTARRLQDLYATLQRSEDRLRLVIDTIPAHVWSARPDGSVDFINQRFLESTGLSMEGLLGWGWDSVVHPDDLARFLGDWRVALATGEPMESEVRIRRADGDYRSWLVRNVPLRDERGKLVNWYGTAIDIEERHRAEDALRRSEAYLAEAQRLSKTGSFGWNVSSGEILWSEETFRIFQYDRTTKPTLELILQRVHLEDAAQVKATIERASLDGKDFEHGYRLLMPDGTVKHVDVVAHAGRGESGEIEFVGAVMDISDRRRAEEDLRQSETLAEQRLRLVVDTTPAMINTCRPDGYLDYVNKGWLDYFGFSLETALDRADVMKMSAPSQDEMSLRDWQPVIYPDDLRRFTDHWKRTLASGKPDEQEGRVRRFDGVYRWHLFRAVPLYDESGKPVKWYVSAFDIEDRKRAEEALRRSESYLTEAQKLTRTGSWAWNVASRAGVYWSQENFRLFGFDPEEGIPPDEAFYQRVHPEDREWVRREVFLERPDEGSHFDVEFRIVLPGGAIKYLRSTGHPVHNMSGELIEYIGTSIDVTERKQAEALRDGESRILEMIARDAPLEETLEKLVRVVEGQFAGLLCSVLLLDEDGQHVRHGAAPSLPEAYIKAIDGLCVGPKAGSCGTAMYRKELVVVTDILQDPLWESYRDVAESCGIRACWSTPILAHSGKALGSFAMHYPDPGSPSPAETRALELANHLAGIAIERKLAREERERLRQAQVELAHVNRVTTMGELTASLAHEVNQPIAAAVISANTCVRWLAGEVPNLDKARAAAARIVNDATRAAEIISRIRLLFQKGSPQMELVDVNEVIEEMIVLLRGEATRYEISVRTELAADLPPVMGDRVQLQQVMMNLMINSIDAMRTVDGSRELAIKSQPAENERILVSVSDTGVGLPTQADQIFNAFFTTKPHGTGMGLRICRSIVESHGGRMWAASKPRHGAVFSLTLPASFEAHR